MPAQLFSVMVTSLSISQNIIAAITALTKEKKSQKPKIASTSFTKKAVVKAKRPIVNNLIDDLANIVYSIFFQNAKNQAEYEDCAFAYYYSFYLIFRSFNKAEFDVLFSTSLPSFCRGWNEDRKNALRDAFKSAYYYVKCKLIENITAKANL